jgi:PhoH-like ATPase
VKQLTSSRLQADDAQDEEVGREAGIVVLDTSALVADPSAPTAYPGCDVVIPVTVIEELDSLKARANEQGASARRALRNVEQLCRDAGAPLDGCPVPLPGGGTLRVEINQRSDEMLARAGLPLTKADNLILSSALGQRESNPGRLVTLVSHDTALRVKAASFGLATEERAVASPATIDQGWRTIEVTSGLLDDLHRNGVVGIEDLAEARLDGGIAPLLPNCFLVLRSGGSQSALARLEGTDVIKLRGQAPQAWGLQPRSKEQRFALELLFNPDVQVVAMLGPAGTGKTLLAIAAGLDQVVNGKHHLSSYMTVGVYRPIVGVGRQSLGMLPGDLSEKLSPWVVPITDALAALHPGRARREVEVQRDNLVRRGQLEFGSIEHVRGRSIADSWILIDEAQNLEVSTVKALLTRVASGSKIVLCGDPTQIDSPWLSPTNNGLSAMVAALAGERRFGHIVLTQGERSDVSEMAARLM